MEAPLEFLFILRIRPACHESEWQATLRDLKTEEKQVFATIAELARHLEGLAKGRPRGIR